MKKGNSIISIPLMLILSIFTIIVIGTYIINYILPFIYYQKLNLIANKYMFIIEKFGYLTEEEAENLKMELTNSGFDINKILLDYPDLPKDYGELIQFKITYKLIIKYASVENNRYNIKEKETILKIRKNSFSKI